MEELVYPKMNTLVKMYETRLLPAGQWEELRQPMSAGAYRQKLRHSGFFAFAVLEEEAPFSAWLQAEKEGWLAWGREISPTPHIMKLFSYEDSVHNMQVYMKEKVLNRDLSAHYWQENPYNQSFLKALLEERQGDLNAEEQQVRDLVREEISRSVVQRSFFLSELAFKLHALDRILALAEDLEDHSTLQFMKAYVDIQKKLLAGQLAIRPEKTEGPMWDRAPLKEFKEWQAKEGKAPFSQEQGQQALLESCREARLRPFGLFPLVALLFAKNMEIRMAGQLWQTHGLQGE